MADHAKPTLTSPYADFLSEIMARVDDVAKGNNSGLTLANPPVGTVRWNTSTSKWESNTGTVAVPVWTALATLYSIRVATADAFTTGRTIAVTGDATGTSAAFTGAGNLSFAITFATVNANVGTFGSAAAVPVITVDAKGRVTAVGTAALGSMAAQSASNVAITGGSVSVTHAIAVGTGNAYNTAGFETTGNGATNTVFPAIGFHQPGLWGSTLQCKANGSFYFYNQSNVLGTVYATTFSGALSGNATTATKASTLAQNGGAGAAMTFNWSGQAGQPSWLWGGSDGANMYVYNPSNFSVNYATSSGSCSGNAATATTATTAGAVSSANCSQTGDGWWRSSGATGWYSTSYSVGIYATEAGNVRTYGTGTNFIAAGNVTGYSDETVKTNWRSFGPDFVARLAQVKSGVYDRTDVEMTQVGVGAQSFRDLMPHAILTDKSGKLSVAYGNAALAACVELAKELVQLKAQTTAQELLISNLLSRLDGLTRG